MRAKRIWMIALTLTLVLTPAAQAATPGLPFIEDFSTPDLQDPQLTNANWSSQAQALMLAERHVQFGAFGPGLSGVDITADSYTTASVALGDLDGDGDLDLVTGNSAQYDEDSEPNRLYLNDGTANPANWMSGNITADAHRTWSVALGDVDGDGDLDLVVGNYNRANRLYLNNGTANPFNGVSGSDITADAHKTHSVALRDVDRDGDLDIVVGNYGQANRLYLNDGNSPPTWTGSDITSDAHDTTCVALGDVDGDGDLDIVAGNHNQINRLYRNDGGSPPTWSGSNVTTDAHYTTSAALGDIDGDGDLDLVVGNSQVAGTGQVNRLYLNDGGSPLDWSSSDITADGHRTRSVALGDVDGDGDLDIVVGNNWDEANRLYRNDGNSPPAWSGSDVTADAHDSYSVALGDVDGDGNLDIVVGNYGGPGDVGQVNRLYFNNGSPNPFNGVSGRDVTADGAYTYAVALGDVDGDGDLDLVVGNYNQANRLYLNDGTATPFDGVSGRDITADVRNTRSVALGDVDGDGDLDLVVGNYNQADQLYLNDGHSPPGWTAHTVAKESYRTYSVALGDVDGDGDLDLVAGNSTQANRLYLNNGTANPFSGVSGSDITTDAAVTRSVALGDVDGDGDLDLVAGNYGQPNRLYLNNGTATPFDGVSGSDITADAHNTYSVALGDVDGDGDLDLVAGNCDNQINRLYLNNGTATPFNEASGSDITTDAAVTRSVALGDVDGDGDLDLVAGNTGQVNRLYLNNGTTTPFSGVNPSDITADAHQTTSVTLGDVDGDGDLDLVAGNYNQANRLYQNVATPRPTTGWIGSDISADAHVTLSVALGDVDRDGDLDLVTGNAGQANQLYLNNGTANPFNGVSGSNVTADAHETLSVALGDVDGDGDLDLVAGNYTQANRLYLNNGTANPFEGVNGSDITSDAHNTQSVALGDVDGDGDLDLVVGNYNQANRLYLNNGHSPPGWTGSNITAGACSTYAVALGDIDRDGDLDLVVGNSGPNQLYLNDDHSPPGWTGSNITADAHDTFAVALGDVDGDGDLDLVAGNYNQRNRGYENNGTADPFNEVSGNDITTDAHRTISVAVGDVDGDGDPDLVVGNIGQANRLYLNNGTPNLLASDVTADAHNTTAVALGDVDGDGGLDLAVGNTEQANRLYRRQLYHTGQGRAGSLRVDDETSDIDQVTLYPSAILPPNTGVTYWLSNNGGTRWFIVRPGVSFDFATNGMDLRWRAELHSLSPVLMPRVDQVAIGDLEMSPPTRRWVTHTGDGGSGSLRWAITRANESSGPNTVMFDIPAATDPGCVAASGVCTIQPASALPALNHHGTLVDGYTQSGATPATATTPAALKIELDGTYAGTSASGLTLHSASNTIRGLVINRFDRHGINVYGSKTAANVIAGNYVGTDVSGSVDLGNAQHGVRFGLNTFDNTVGGDTSADRNVISGNDLAGIEISHARHNMVSGNYVGTDAAGEGALGNGYGVHITDGAQDNTVGPHNVIAHNLSAGVEVLMAATLGNVITHNSIFSNVEGISLAPGANGGIAAPVIFTTAQGSVHVIGTACAGCTVEVFENGDVDGEGETFFGDATADAGGHFTVTVSALTQPYLTATATDAISGTSEFSAVFTATLSPAPSFSLVYLPVVIGNH